MRTGKYQYLKYVTIWAVNIIANVKGYSLERAYEINPLFGQLVESKIKYYEQQLEYVKRVAMSFQVYDDMLVEYGNFQKQLNEDTEWLSNNRYDWGLDYETEFWNPGEWVEGEAWGSYTKEQWQEEKNNFDRFLEKNKEAIALNELIMKRIDDLHNSALSLSENRMKGYPSDIRLQFQELKQLALDQWMNFKVLNKQILFDEFNVEQHIDYYDEVEQENLNTFYQNVHKELDTVIDYNVVAYAQGMDYLRRRRSDLDD